MMMGKTSIAQTGGGFQSSQKGKEGFSWKKNPIKFKINLKSSQGNKKNWALRGPGTPLCSISPIPPQIYSFPVHLFGILSLFFP